MQLRRLPAECMVQGSACLVVRMSWMVKHTVHCCVVVLEWTTAGLSVVGRVNGGMPGVRRGHSLLDAGLLTEVLHFLLHVGRVVV